MKDDEKSFLKDIISKLSESNLPLSAHTIIGWYGNFERVKRFFSSYIEETDANKKLDYAMAFFIFSYHLRDWILSYEKINKSFFEQQWNLFIEKYPEVKISRDICNVSKHLKITQESADKDFALFWEYDPFFTKENDWTIIYGQEKERLSELMRRVLNAWGDFILNFLKLSKK